MPDNKKEAAQEVPVLKQSLNIICPSCHEQIVIAKRCPNCNYGYGKNANYCSNCGTKLISLSQNNHYVDISCVIQALDKIDAKALSEKIIETLKKSDDLFKNSWEKYQNSQSTIDDRF